MKTRFRVLSMALAVTTLAAPITLFAHHGSAIYDESKGVTVKGVVTEWLWANPHCLLEMDVKDEKGNTVTWTGEFSSPSSMLSEGMSKSSFKPGDEIAVTVIPAKGGTPYGLVLKIVRPDGKVVVDLSERRGVLLQ